MNNINIKKVFAELFNSWNILKQTKHFSKKTIGIKERDIVFIHMGQNVGYEQDGKGDEFLRPIVITKAFNKDMFLGIALTTKIKEDRFHFKFRFTNKNNTCIDNCAILSQVKFYDTKRIKYKTGTMNKDDFLNMYEKFLEITKPKCVTPTEVGEPRRDSIQ